jgi:hypothetical protein
MNRQQHVVSLERRLDVFERRLDVFERRHDDYLQQ